MENQLSVAEQCLEMADVQDIEPVQGRRTSKFVENCVKSSASSSREKYEECFSLYDTDR